MKDQYDDGRYDSVVHNAYLERANADFDGVVQPGGWCIPAEQAVGWPFNRSVIGVPEFVPGFPFNNLDRLLTPVRGGMKYPALPIPKGTPVAKTLNQQLAALKETQATLGYQIEELTRKIRTGRRVPPAEQNMWTIDVQFTPDGQRYTYLIYRYNGMFYTTGTGTDGKFFSWTQMLAWLDGVSSHSALIPLVTDPVAPAPLEGRH